MTNIDEFIFKNWNVQRENSIHHEYTAKWVFKKWMHGCAEHWTKNITFLEPWQPSSRVTTALASCATDPFCQALNLILMGSHRAHSSVSGSHCLMWRLWDLCTRVGVPWSVPFSLLRSIPCAPSTHLLKWRGMEGWWVWFFCLTFSVMKTTLYHGVGWIKFITIPTIKKLPLRTWGLSLMY